MSFDIIVFHDLMFWAYSWYIVAFEENCFIMNLISDDCFYNDIQKFSRIVWALILIKHMYYSICVKAYYVKMLLWGDVCNWYHQDV